MSLAMQRVGLLMLLLVRIIEAQGQLKLFNVKKYGAIADGKTDNAKVYSFLVQYMLFKVLRF